MKTFDISNDTLLSGNDVCRILGISRSTLERYAWPEKYYPAGFKYPATDFPKPYIQLGTNYKWLSSEIQAYVERNKLR